MKNKRNILTIVIVFVMTLGLLYYNDGATKRSNMEKMTEWGEILKENSKASDEEEIFAKGKNGVIFVSEVEKTRKFFELSGMKEDEAKEQAIQYSKEIEALYQEALREGYEATEEEIWAYIEEIKKTVKESDNREEVEAVIKQFDSEEEYWNYEYTVYTKNLPIQNYVEDKEKEFREKSANADDDKKFQKEWEEEFTKLKKDLVEKEEFQVVKK